MPKTTIFYNPDCSKCREALCLLEEASAEVEIVEYLTNTPSREELQNISKLLGLHPIDFMRKGEVEFIEHFEGKTLSEEECYHAMLRFPNLIERPIVIQGNKALIGRPPSKVLELI